MYKRQDLHRLFLFQSMQICVICGETIKSTAISSCSTSQLWKCISASAFSFGKVKSVSYTHLSSSPSQAAPPPSETGFNDAVSACRRMARQPRFFAISTRFFPILNTPKNAFYYILTISSSDSDEIPPHRYLFLF